MGKHLFTVDDDLLEFLKNDAKRCRRSMSAQVCTLLELCRKYNGYDGLVEKLIVNSIKNTQKEISAAPIRKRKPGSIAVEPHEIPGCALILYNKTKKIGLAVKISDYKTASEYIKEALENGSFIDAETQDSYFSGDSFRVYDAIGENMEEVINNHKGQIDMYNNWVDLSEISDANKGDL